MRPRFLALGVAAPWLLCCAGRVGDPVAGGEWLARAQQHIATREYRVSENGQGLQAPNRAHALRTYFEKTGIRVHDRTSGTELLRLSLVGVGRGEQVRTAAPGQEVVTTHENRVVIRRAGLVEWYLNSEAGLEQGFTLETRPPGTGPLALELAISGAAPSLQGDAIVLVTRAQRTLRYGELVAIDGDGDPVAAHFDLPGPDRLRIVLEDADAAYPVLIDPLLTETFDTQFHAIDMGAELGASVASAGDVNGDGYADVIVGARLYDAGQADEGAAFVFHGSPSGIASGSNATAAAQLESDQAGAQLGAGVAGAGDVNGDGYGDVIVGAATYTAGQPGEGAAFVFLGSATGVADGNPATAATQLESDQTTPIGQGLPGFGISVAAAGDVNGDGYADVIVGARFYDVGAFDEGAAFVFLGSATGVADGTAATAATQLLSDQFSGWFGFSTAGAGDVNGDGYGDVIVGAPFYDAGQGDEGAAFVFLGSASGIASGGPATAAAQLESDQQSAGLGFVAGAGDVNGDGYADVIVGSPGYQSTEGRAFVFLGSGAGIADGTPATAATQLESNQPSATLGWGVAGAGDVNGDGYGDVIVGARWYDAGQSNEGVALVFLGSSSGIASGNPATAAAQLESDQPDAELGLSVAGAGDVNGDGYADVIVGAQFFDFTHSDGGAAFIYHGGSHGIADGNPGTAASQLEGDQVNPTTFLGSLGTSVAGAGDVNGDGYGDVIAGAPAYDAGEADEGAAFVFLGSAAGVADGSPATAATQLEANQPGTLFGLSAASAGDVNGDGYADVIVGAPFYDAGHADEGAAFVFVGSASGIAHGGPATAAAQLESDQPGAGLGFVAGAGDVNGDGYADVIAGAAGYSAGQAAEGAAFVFPGSAAGIADGTPATAATQLESDQANANLGLSVAGAGDVNGDGYGDVIVGAHLYDAGLADEGAAFVFLGSGTGIADGSPATAVAQLESDQESASLGSSVAGAGDVDGDGYGDVIVGAYLYDAGQSNEGAGFVFLGTASGIADGTPATAAAQLQSDQASAQLGFSVAGIGDVNGDGYADVIVGTPAFKNGQTDEGAAFVFLGSASGVTDGKPTTAAAQLESDQADARLGVSVAGAGDVNGDGFADAIVGANRFDAGQNDEGAAFVFLGNGEGRPVLARQRRGNGSGVPVQPWGLAQSTTGFTAELRASHPEGTGRVKAQLEACPPGVPFGNGSCTTALTPTWVSVNGSTPETLLSQTFTGLTNDTLYHWRARVLHAAATGTIPANPAHGPWRRLGAQAVEADIRLPEPELLLSLACGLALVAVLARRRTV